MALRCYRRLGIDPSAGLYIEVGHEAISLHDGGHHDVGMAGWAADLAPVLKAAPAPAATPSPFDIAFGVAAMTDYNFRGISQSNRTASVSAYSEFRYNIVPTVQLYAGISGESISFPNRSPAEIDFYAGIRPTFGALALDFGVWYYAYTAGNTFTGAGAATTCANGFFTPTGFCNSIKGNLSFWEVYAKALYTFNDSFALGANVFYDPSWLNSGAPGVYASATFKFTAPSGWLGNNKDWGAYFSGELGYYWLGTTDAFYGTPAFPAGIDLPDYATWNLGVGLTYKIATLDLRYYDTNLSRGNCNVLTGAQTATFALSNVSLTNPSGLGTNWCSSAFIAKLSLDSTLNAWR